MLPPGEKEYSVQGVHMPPSGPEEPALHVQAVDPASALYSPATHSIHGPPSGPVHPLLQVQAELPNEESAFVGHVTHVDD